MFGKNKEQGGVARIDSLIGVGTSVEGVIRFSGGLRIDGEVRGTVEAIGNPASTTLVISDQAKVEGAVTVGHLVLNGAVVGPVHVSNSIEMQPKARIIGDVSYAVIEMHQGAVIEGRLVHHPKEEPIEGDGA